MKKQSWTKWKNSWKKWKICKMHNNINDKNKRDLIFLGKKGEYFSFIAKHLIKYFEDADIEDFQINDFNKVTLIKKGGIKEFVDDENLTKQYIKTLMYFVASLAPKQLRGEDNQISIMLPLNKFRFSGMIGSDVISGIKISIRLNDSVVYHSHSDFGVSDLEFNFLVHHIATCGLSCFVIGGTGSGKTTFNNLLIKHIDDNQLINVIGDIHDYIFFGEQKVSEITAKKDEDYIKGFDLLMRSNPDRILVPELSVGNVNLILRALNSGHKGFMLTMHAGDVDGGVANAFVKNLALSGVEVKPAEVEKDINSNVDFLLHLHKNDKGKRCLSKVIINNEEVYQEACSLGIFGFKNIKAPIKQLTTKDEIKAKYNKIADMAKLVADLQGGLPKSIIAKKYGYSRGSIIKIAKIVLKN